MVRQFFKRRPVSELAVSLAHTHEPQGPSTSITRSPMPQLFTAFSLRLSSAGGQKCDFCKSHSRGGYEVVHSFWNVKVWQSGVRHRHWPIFSFFSKIWLRLIDGENFLDCFFSWFSWYLLKMKKRQYTAVLQISHLLYLSKFNRS